ncbi:MAG TPA: bifunctional phosphoribosyl-AMP cyclohydrolase/phosphoribosyl-ATP diphosphatase HisIE [Oscillospiraceae bacterium]|nr:bifunctional phosphoribosyl-AMP cyclohydrolase/phosphoribosyl-ATP diphosphatase HisIE [Oscillospiraceae bacterium]HPS35090.1 bifunctional phosphoribosyl-AMP cyclohydrolase/phosphoribosyl-ATP diphosphatase HisIE [Oscillospiraceae bacterium]
MNIDQLKFDSNGLIPAVVQDFYSRKVLTVAYMNREALEITLAEKKTCFFSRNRQKLWRKGETSGNFQHVVRITADCDGDALNVEVIKDGPACHTGKESCFYETVYEDAGAEKNAFSLDALYGLLCDRKEKLPEGSYTTYLFQKGKEKILKKVGEESTEVVVAAMKSDKKEAVCEIADLCYHTLVLMAEMGITPSDVSAELASRSVVDHKIKQGG